MTEKIIGRFEVKWLQILDENGHADEKLMPEVSDSVIKKIYEWMALTRTFDDKALKLQRQGKMGTYAPVKGQEAQVAAAFAIEKEDFIFPAFRENGVYLARGMPPAMMFNYWMGDERGSAIPKGVGMFPVSITVGAQPLHAVGAGMALNIQKRKNAILTFFGDGATSEGDCLEAFNFAGVYKTPVVFICQNNQWAISLPVSQQTASETLAQKAIAFGFEGIRVDGNDVFAVYRAVKLAVERAKAGKGPSLIEMLTYRMGDHTTSDDAKRYRKEEELKEWEKKDPISRLEKYMELKGIFSEKYKKEVWDKAQKTIDLAANQAEMTERYKPEEIFDYLYAELTPDLKEQKQELKRELASMPQFEGKESQDKKKSTVQEKGFGVVGELEEA